MEREIIRVEPFDSSFQKWGAPVSACTRAGPMVFVSGMRPFDPETGEIAIHAPFERHAELILEQMKTALEAAGSTSTMCASATFSASRPSASKPSTKSTSVISRKTRRRGSSSACRSGRGPSTSRSTASPSRRSDRSATASVSADDARQPFTSRHRRVTPRSSGTKIINNYNGLSWSGRRESNPRMKLGKLPFYH